MIRLSLFSAVLFSLFGTSCSAVHTAREVNELYAADLKKRLDEYVVKPGDVITIKLYNQQGDLNQVGTILSDGKSDLVLANDTKVLGKTIPELRAELKARFASEVRDPEISIQVTPSPEEVVLFGQWETPGPISLTRNMTLGDALARAGGALVTAKPWGTILRRPYRNPLKPDYFFVDVYDTSEEILLLPGDTIEMDYNWLSFTIALIREYIFGVIPSQFYSGAGVASLY